MTRRREENILKKQTDRMIERLLDTRRDTDKQRTRGGLEHTLPLQ